MAGMVRHEDPGHSQLTELARSGDAGAWEILIARHQRRVLLVLLARGVLACRAEEIVQEAWTRLIAKSRDGRLDRLELPGLAIAQAVHLSLDDARATRGRSSTSLDESDEARNHTDDAPGALEQIVSREALERAVSELARCPPKAREVFELIYENPELAHVDAARIVGLSVQRLRQTLCEVRARLRDAIAKED